MTDATPHRLTKEQIEAWRDWWHEPHLHTRPEGKEFAVLCDMALFARSESAPIERRVRSGFRNPERRDVPATRSASREPKPYDVMADAVCEIADAARQAFVKAGFDPGEWDGDNIVQDVKRGLVDAVETLAARSATGAMELVEQIAVCIETSTWGEATSRRSLANVIRENFGGKNSEGPPIPPAHRPVA